MSDNIFASVFQIKLLLGVQFLCLSTLESYSSYGVRTQGPLPKRSNLITLAFPMHLYSCLTTIYVGTILDIFFASFIFYFLKCSSFVVSLCFFYPAGIIFDLPLLCSNINL